MGEHKALLKFDENHTFIEKIAGEYLETGIEDIVVVVNSDLYKLLMGKRIPFSGKVRLVINDHPESGRFYSLQTGAKLIEKGNSCFFQNIDNPFTSKELLHELMNKKHKADIVIPAFGGRSGHPVLVSAGILMQILNEKVTDVRIDHFLSKFSRMMVETLDNKILANINSLAEYRKAGFED